MVTENKKVILVSFVNTDNFGNRLQQYALQHIVEQQGYDTTILSCGRTDADTICGKIKYAAKFSYLFLSKSSELQRYRSLHLRKIRFLSKRGLFYRNMIYIPEDKLNKADWGNYKYAIAGSDQIWCNRYRSKGELYHYYLGFLPAEKRISYAPSFGFSEFPMEDLKDHIKGLQGMKYLSCREQEGCDLIEKLVHRKAQKVLDPTLLLDIEEWIKIENKPLFDTPSSYILLFFLGTITEEYQCEIDEIIREYQCSIININDFNVPTHFAISPDEFLWLIHHARVVCTDSFHACVFSITYQTDLRVFRRKQARYEDMFGRIFDLLKPIGLIENIYGEGQKTGTELSEQAKSYIIDERVKSIDYLMKSLEGILKEEPVV